jgi:alkanesulfonate monooxygenase SsuD/methylene tetrahydromethanopterin reductase-like flavin-dependent oxidoreductase (luciferase family)
VTFPVGLTAPQFGNTLEPVLRAAGIVESYGFAGLFFFDHLVPIGAPDRPVLELAGTIGAVAAATDQLTLGSLVMRAPMRGVGISTAIASTAATIAPGRFVLGLGAGDSMSADEDRRFGRTSDPLSERVQAVREVLEATSDRGFDRWIGGLHPRLLELMALAEGWNGWGVDVDRVPSMCLDIRRHNPTALITWGGSVVLGTDDRDLDAVASGRTGHIVGTPDRVASELLALRNAGVESLVLSVLPNVAQRWEMFAETVLPKLD